MADQKARAVEYRGMWLEQAEANPKTAKAHAASLREPQLPATALPETLPPALAELATALGPDGLWRLLSHYGGIRIYLPRTLTAAHPLARDLGLETARALCQHLGPYRYDVPTGRDLFRQMRDQDIRAAHAQGDSIRTLARRFRLSERRVRRVLASTLPPPTTDIVFNPVLGQGSARNPASLQWR